MTNNEKLAPLNGRNDFGARPPQKCSLETGLEALEHGLGDTANDISDMKRLGKKQEFRVRRPVFSLASVALG